MKSDMAAAVSPQSPSAVPLENQSSRFDSEDRNTRSDEFRVWPQDATTFSTHSIARIKHNLHQHPLMGLDQLQTLATELLPLSGCRFLAPDTTSESRFDHQSLSHKGLAIQEVFQRIEEPGSWVALYNIENIPRYRRLLHEAVNSVRPLVEREQPGIFAVTGFMFISAPPSVTPFHIDRENNFWLQIRGRKFITLWDRNDTQTLPTDVVESFIVDRDLDRVRLNETVRARGKEFDNAPGDGMYFPSTTPHMTRTTTDWVKPGDGVSISFGVNFYTSVTRRHAKVHQVNRLLRRTGMSPRPPGQQAWRDGLKAPFGRAVVGFLKMRRKDYEVPPGGI
jgi:hypothetical protein